MQYFTGFLFGLLTILILIQDINCHWIGGWGGGPVVGGFGGFGGYGGYGRGFGGGFYGPPPPPPLFYPPPPIFFG